MDFCYNIDADWAFLSSLTIDQMNNIGHIIVRIVGFGSIFVAGFIVRGKKEE
ncbi:hypothetical protein [Geobacillus sp. FSL K6-3411]|uniref:hypothetical protein n=1 Tax=Geobacillus sp. FSL K6-3411 TaxID=2954614 RepID=UPI000A29169E|nr:hypothetical protein GTHT12_01550 [Geobacillus thermodenitrificans]